MRGRLSFGLQGIALGLGVLLLCVPACSTLVTVASGDKYLYAGTRTNIEALMPAHAHDEFIELTRCVAVCDFACSLALDTALLPVTLPLQIIFGDRPRTSSEPPRDRRPEEK
jgi:uncharacterized protein YceK